MRPVVSGHPGTLLRAVLSRVLTRLLPVVLMLPAVPALAVQSPVGHMSPAMSSMSQFEDIGLPDAVGLVQFPCQKRPTHTCYGPLQIRAAYGFDKLPSRLTGAGVTIVIIGAFGAPTLSRDLAAFDTAWGLPAPTLNVIAPDGLLPFTYANRNMVLGASEATVDVEWAHAIAPGATIDLVMAKTLDDPDVLSADLYAVNRNLGAILSQSIGEPESCMAPAIQKAQHEAFKKAREERITVVVSAGDHGAAGIACDGSPNFSLSIDTPASDPLVTSIGGTTLHASLETGAYASETAWTDMFGRGGGGFSSLYKRPSYQRGSVDSKARGVPDVAYNSGVEGGFVTAFSFPNPNVVNFFAIGGTSAATPQWAGLVALADQAAGRRLGFLNDSLYSIGRHARTSSAFHDITVGDNTWVYTNPAGQVVTIKGYSAAPGWDAVTGWGSPKANVLVPLLASSEHGDGEGGSNGGDSGGGDGTGNGGAQGD
jgi:subtilase family serine protease